MARKKIPKLYDLAFRGALIHLWEQSRLPSLVVVLAYRKNSAAKLNHINTKENEKEDFKKMQSALEIIEESLMKVKYLSFRLKVKVLAAVAGLNEHITLIMVEIAGGLPRHLKEPNDFKSVVKYCTSKIIFTKNVRVDIKKTILNIIKGSHCKIEFTPEFLAHNCFEPSDVGAIYKIALKEIKKISSVKNRKHKDEKTKRRIEDLKLFMEEDTIDPECYWMQAKVYSRRAFNDPRFHFVSDLQYAAVMGHDVLKFFYKLEFSSEPTQETRQDVLMETAKFAFLKGAFSEGNILFFYKNLQLNFWTELLQKYFKPIFLSLLGSWRYRYLCEKFFKDIIDYRDVEKLKDLFNRIADLCDKQTFEYYDIISVIQSVWFETPQDFKEDIQIRQVVIPRLILPRADFETLIHFLKSYCNEMQKEILGQVVFGLLATGRKELIHKCLETAKRLDLQISDCKELVDKDSLKQFLIIDAQINRNSYCYLDSVTDLLCSSKSEELKLKKEFFSDSAFLLELLVNMLAKEGFDNILQWGLGDENSVNIFRKKLLKEELIHDVYDRRLIENNDLETADNVFVLLKYDAEEIAMVRERVAENTLVVMLMLTSLLETDHLELTEKYLTYLFRTKDEQQQFMECFLFSENGKKAIFDTLLTLENLELCPTLRFSGVQIMKKCWYIKTFWLRPFSLVVRMTEMLEKCRSEFMTHRIVVEDNDNLNDNDRITAALYADAIFRGFTQIVQKDFTISDLDYLEYTSIVDAVETLERQIGSFTL